MKKKAAPKKKEPVDAELAVKNKSLFDHINHIFSVQDPNYFSTLTEGDKKTWSNYMVHRFISMCPDYIEIVNELQKYTLSPESLYKTYIDLLPRKRQFHPYIKGAKADKYEQWLLDLLCMHFEDSEDKIKDYIEIFLGQDDGKQELISICEMYGHTLKEVEKAIKQK